MANDTLSNSIKVFDDKIKSLSLTPFEYNNVFYVHEYVSSISENEIRSLFEIDLHNCRFCIERIKKFCRISDQKGPILLQFFTHDSQINAINKICKGKFLPKILDNNLFLNYEKYFGGFPHVYFPTKYTTITNTDIIQSAVNRYIRDGLLENLIKNLLMCNDNDQNEVIKSLECFIQCCLKATYGENFIKTAKWLISIMKSYSKNDNIDLYMKALIDAGIEKDLSGAIVTKFHQANENILSLLQNARTEKTMTKLIEDRLNPYNYRRRDPSANLTAGNIENAMKHLGDFENTIMTHEEVSKLPYSISLISKNCGSMNIFEEMKSSLKPKGSFASRCSNIDIKNIETFEELYSYLEKNPNKEVYINSNGMHPLYVAKTTLDKEKLKFPHMWAFSRSIKISSGWVKVKYIIPMYKYIESHKNIAFILEPENVLTKSEIRNCCFPEFLTSAYARTCDKAFERLNILKNITIPSGNTAIGVGTSISVSSLVQSINIKINGVELKINKA